MDETPLSGSARAVRCASTAQRAATYKGQANGNELAKRGYSRDHRPDCKQVCIALVVSFDGFPLGYEVFAGNTHDSTTLQRVLPANVRD